MDTFLIKAAQLILAFAILVIIHEFGHFLFARIFGVRVEKFYIFFDPWKEIFKWKPKRYWGFFGAKKKLKDYNEAEDGDAAETAEAAPLEVTATELKPSGKKKSSFWGDTEYGIGWLPLGGYCKISGMIDESMDTEQMKREPQPWEFRSKPAWQRLLIMVAGVLFNFLLAILIYAGIVFTTGEKYVPVDKASMGMEYSGEARKIGFHNGDIPFMADGDILSEPTEARLKMIQAKEVKVLRISADSLKRVAGVKDTVSIAIPGKFMFALDNEAKSDTATVNFMTYRFPARITQVSSGEGADKAGILPGDEITSVDGIRTASFLEFLKTLQGHENQTVKIGIRRNAGGKASNFTVPVALSEYSKMGIGLEVDPAAFFESKEIHYNIFQSIPRGVEMGTDKLTSYAKSMKLVFTKEGANSIGGFGAIGSIFPEKWDWIAFWNIAAFLSVALAFMNILPIPALDGGHVLFLLYEVIFRRKPSDKFLERAQIVGMTLLILLLLYANGMDIVRLFK